MRRKKDKNYAGIAVALFIAFIMVTAVMGYFFADNGTINYNGYKFTPAGTSYKTNIQGQSMDFLYAPTQVQDSSLPEGLNIGNPLEIDTTYEFNATNKESIAAAIFNLANNLQKVGIFVRQGQSTNYSANIPIITCAQATQFVPVIHYRYSNETNILLENNCIIIESRDASYFTAATERIQYHILGVME